MEAMTGKGAKPPVTGTPLHHGRVSAKSVPNYLRPSTGSCHDACKHGGHHEFEEKEPAKAKPRPRKQPSASDDQKRRLIKVRSVSRRRVGDLNKPAKDIMEAADMPVGEAVEWKDIVAYDTVPVPADGKKRDVMKGKKPFAKSTEQEIGAKKQQTESLNKKLAKTVRSTLTRKSSTNPQAADRATKTSPSDKNVTGKSTKAPKAKKTSTTLPVEKKVVVLQETAQGDATASVKQGRTLYPPDQEEHAAAIAESSRPIPAHRRVKSMSISSRSVRFPFIRQQSKNSDTFKLRSKSSKAPEEEEKPTRLRFRKGRSAGEESSSGIQLRIRSLRRRGSGVSGGAASAGFVVPEVTLRHQKTLEKKSRRLYNNLIEETASKLAKSKKSRVKSLVGAFETLISKIGK